MKNILFGSMLAVSLMFLTTGCYGEKAEGVKSSKCGASEKCGSGKTDSTTKKCGDGKCGSGK